MHKFLLTIFIVITCHAATHAQDQKQWASPNVKYMPIGRGLDISYTRIFSTQIDSESEVPRIADNNANLGSIENMEFDLKIPVIIKERTKFLASIEYTYDHFRFENYKNLDYELYETLDRRNLKSRKLKLYLVHSFNQTNYINARGSAALNGDLADSEDSFYEFAKYSFSITYGWQKNPYNAYGFGLYLDYTLGKPAIYPVVEWNKTWNKKWGFESKLPAKFLVRFTPNSNMLFYGGYKVTGISYRLVAQTEDTDILKEFEVRKSDIRLYLNFEKRIYDFLWFGLAGGINYNLRLDVSDNDQLYNEKKLISNHLKTTPFIKASLFVVPSESLKQMFGYN